MNRGRVLVLLPGAAVDASAGLVASAATILWRGEPHAQVPVFVVACTGAAVVAQAVLVPGWFLATGAPMWSALTARLPIALTSFAQACTASCASAIVFLMTGSARLTGNVMLLVFAGTTALGVAQAQAVDPGDAGSAGARAGMIAEAVAGAVAAWLGGGLIWALAWIDPPQWANDTRIWWGAPPAAGELPPMPDLMGRAGAAGGALVLLAALWRLAP